MLQVSNTTFGILNLFTSVDTEILIASADVARALAHEGYAPSSDNPDARGARAARGVILHEERTKFKPFWQ